MEFRDLRLALRRHAFAALVIVLFFFATGVLAGTLPRKAYTAQATLTTTPGDSATGVANASFLIPTFVTLVSTDNFYARVRAAVPPPMANVAVSLQASNQIDTGLITVSAHAPDANSAATWATTAANALTTDATVQQSGLTLSLIQAASVPSSPSSPKPLPLIVGMTLLGVIAAVLEALAAEWTARSRDVAATVSRRLGAPLLCQLPKVRGLGGQGRGITDILGARQLRYPEKSQEARLTESAQELRTNVEGAIGGRPLRSIAVVSGELHEGSSTVASCLAIGLARVGYVVTAVDADMRSPRLHTNLKTARSPGLGELLSGDGVAPRRTAVGGLALVPAGTADRHPAEVIRLALPSTLDALASCDYVVVDCPALAAATESTFILTVCRQAVLVIDGRRLRSKAGERTVEQIRGLGVEVLGVVVNRSGGRRLSGWAHRRRPAGGPGRRQRGANRTEKAEKAERAEAAVPGRVAQPEPQVTAGTSAVADGRLSGGAIGPFPGRALPSP